MVYLFDDNGDRKDKFKTKPADSASTTNYIVRAMAFSPDSTKLAIAQSDNIVFVYRYLELARGWVRVTCSKIGPRKLSNFHHARRLGDQWADKKSICNKFLQPAAVTCLIWPKGREDVVFGCADGKVKLGMLKANKPFIMYTHPDSSYVVNLAGSPTGHAVLSAHLDGSIFKFLFPETEGAAIQAVQLVMHSCVPYALGWGNSIGAAGNDCRVCTHAHMPYALGWCNSIIAAGNVCRVCTHALMGESLYSK